MVILYEDSNDQALEYARAAVKEMISLGIAASPQNFTVWYEHVAGRDADLTRMISILGDNDQEFDKTVCLDLYSKFFTTDGEEDTLNKTSDILNNELGNIQGYIGEAGEGAASVGAVLATAKEDILGAKDEPSLQKAVGSVLDETGKIVQINRKLENELERSAKQILQLRDDLEDMRKQAMTDALTGIANRKMFDSELRRHARESMEDGGDLTLLMLDIDHFKVFNDSFGHQTGDEVLKLLSAMMTAETQADDIPARYGGEEFAVILPGSDLGMAKQMAEKMRARIANQKLVNRTTGQNLGKITVSVGVGMLKLGEPLGDLIKRTDQALYKAKSLGRNQVVDQKQVLNGAMKFG